MNVNNFEMKAQKLDWLHAISPDLYLFFLLGLDQIQCDQMKISKSGQKFSESGQISGQLYFCHILAQKCHFTAFFAVLKHF